MTTRRTRKGFTLIEVLVVITIMGIAAGVVVPQMLATGTLGVQAAARHVIADVMYVQNEAVAQQENMRLVFEPADNRYRVTDDTGTTVSVAWMGKSAAGSYVVNFNTDERFEGVVITDVTLLDGSNTIEFDDLGTPSTGGTITLGFKDQRFRITVAEFTGRVTVEQLPAVE